MFWFVLFYGSLWGIFEATIGYALHLLAIKIGSFIWLPIACFFMHQVYKSTNKYSSIFYVALVAGSIKLVNLLSPISIDKVINPAVSIILEGIVFTVILYGIKAITPFAKTILFNTFWRVLYIVYLLFVPEWMLAKSALASLEAFIEFMIIANIKSGIGIYLYFKWGEKIKIPTIKNVKPIFAIGGCAISLILTFYL